MRVLRAAEYKSMPWKNGGGVTTQIVVSPAGAELDDFDWRVSMARVEGSGPFSQFAGIDRTLAVLEGEGVVLDIAGWPQATITPATIPFSFPADVATAATLIGGTITDLNVMTRRGMIAHSVERLVTSAPVVIQAEMGTTLVLCLSGEILVSAAEPVRLGPLDALLDSPNIADIRVQPTQQTTLFVIRIRNASGND
ncbi:HutD family protein [Mesorhizobium newzealandense]|uniref:HutD family protein n=1 Tax=Mesorhizobium newzealandense TaxID=1300302 RepID=A0ABW4U9C4_9HYPH